MPRFRRCFSLAFSWSFCRWRLLVAVLLAGRSRHGFFHEKSAGESRPRLTAPPARSPPIVAAAVRRRSAGPACIGPPVPVTVEAAPLSRRAASGPPVQLPALRRSASGAALFRSAVGPHPARRRTGKNSAKKILGGFYACGLSLISWYINAPL